MNENADFLDKALRELSFRVPTGIVDLKNPQQLSIFLQIMNEMDMGEIGFGLIENLREEDKAFQNPILNKTVKYKDKDGEEKEGLVGNLLRLQKDTEGRKAAEKLLPTDLEKRKEVLRDLGDEGQGGRDTNKEKEIEKGKEEGEDEGETPETGTSLSPTTKGGSAYVASLPVDDPAHQSATVYPVGGGYYSDTPDGEPKYKKIDETAITGVTTKGTTVKLEPVDSEEADEERKKKVREGVPEKRRKDVDNFKGRHDTIRDLLSDEENELLDEAYWYMEVLYSENTSDEEKEAAAKWLVENLGLSTNSNGRKAYIEKLKGKRKIWSGRNGINASEFLASTVSEWVPLKQSKVNQAKKGLSTASKPEYGKENKSSPNDEGVQSLFKDPTFDGIEEKDKSVVGPKDENGNIKRPSSEHSMEYLEQSVNSPSLNRTIKTAQRLADEGQIDQKFVDSLKAHKERLQQILKDYPIPSKEASDAILESYRQLMEELHKIDEDMAPAILKNMTESALYEIELAKGDEVYLPASPTFPAGDKIVVDKDGAGLERVGLISIKFGVYGRSYGCPANFSAISRLHPDSEKRGTTGNYVGEPGATLIVKDELIKGETTEESIEKTKNYLKSRLDEVGLGDVFSDEELDEIARLVTELREYIERVQEELKGVVPKSVQMEKLYKKIESKRNEIGQKLGKLVSKEKMDRIIGPKNSSGFMKRDGSVPAESLLGAVEIGNNIRTSGGYGITHAVASFSDTDGAQFINKEGSDNPDDYSLIVRANYTDGRAGGGIQGTTASDTDTTHTIEDDGTVIDSEGKVEEI